MCPARRVNSAQKGHGPRIGLLDAGVKISDPRQPNTGRGRARAKLPGDTFGVVALSVGAVSRLPRLNKMAPEMRGVVPSVGSAVGTTAAIAVLAAGLTLLSVSLPLATLLATCVVAGIYARAR